MYICLDATVVGALERLSARGYDFVPSDSNYIWPIIRLQLHENMRLCPYDTHRGFLQALHDSASASYYTELKYAFIYGSNMSELVQIAVDATRGMDLLLYVIQDIPHKRCKLIRTFIAGIGNYIATLDRRNFDLLSRHISVYQEIMHPVNLLRILVTMCVRTYIHTLMTDGTPETKHAGFIADIITDLFTLHDEAVHIFDTNDSLSFGHSREFISTFDMANIANQSAWAGYVTAVKNTHFIMNKRLNYTHVGDSVVIDTRKPDAPSINVHITVPTDTLQGRFKRAMSVIRESVYNIILI